MQEVLLGDSLPAGRTDAALLDLTNGAGLAEDMQTRRNDWIFDFIETHQTVL
jgi:hypothetical protein